MKEKYWQVGEISELAGVSVKTLHYYDEIGLLSPQKKESNGYRLYLPEDLHKLLLIVSLKQLGLNLKDIQNKLQADQFDAKAVFKDSLKHYQAQQKNINDMIEFLEDVVHHRSNQDHLNTEDMIFFLQSHKKIQQVYSQDEIDLLKKRKKELGLEALKAVENEWKVLIENVQLALDKQLDPKSDEAQALAQQWKKLFEMFTHGDPALAQKAAEIHKNNQAMGIKHPNMPTPEMFAFIKQCLV